MIIIQKKLNSQLLSPLNDFCNHGFQMDILTKISGKIDHLNTGEQWSIRAQDLWISRADFQSLSMYLSKEAEKGKFSIQSKDTFSPRLGGTELIVTKH
jgi:hypothetical protein